MKYIKIGCNLAVAVLIILGIIFVLPKALFFFMPFVIGYLISIPANGIVKLTERHLPVKREHVSAFYIILVLALVVFLLFEGGSALYYELLEIVDDLPDIIAGVKDDLNAVVLEIENFINRIPFVKDVNFDAFVESISRSFLNAVKLTDGRWMTAIAATVSKAPSMVIYTVISILAAYFFIAYKERISEFYQRNVPESLRKILSNMYANSVGAIGAFFKAQLKIMAVIYVVLFVGLLILKVKYAWLVGLGIAVLDMLPIFGTGIVLIPWALIKLISGDFVKCIGLLILSGVAFVIHQVIQPKLISDEVGMNPFVSLIVMFIGYRVGGAMGMLLSIPVGMMIVSMARAGTFDRLLWCIKELITDFNKFRNIDEFRIKEEKKENSTED